MTKAKTKQPAVKLTPPDLKQCQANHLEGAWPDAAHFMVIGPRRLVRCTEKAMFVVTEKRPGKDGVIGSMSLCNKCLARFLDQMGGDFADVKAIE